MRKPQKHSKIAGFTLVELLVVITIIVTLAAISSVALQRLRTRANEAKSIKNIQQIGTMVGIYTAENSSCLPAIKAISEKPDGTKIATDWYIALLALSYPDVDLSKFSTPEWWEQNKPYMRNPLLANERFKPWFNGYAMNFSLANNAFPGATGAFGSGSGADSQPIPLSKIPEPSRTPVVSTTRNWFYKVADLTALTAPSNLDKGLLMDGKVPVCFVDGHVETMTPQDYVSRNLGSMPKKP